MMSGNNIFAAIDLDLSGIILNMSKSGFAKIAKGDYPSRDMKQAVNLDQFFPALFSKLTGDICCFAFNTKGPAVRLYARFPQSLKFLFPFLYQIVLFFQCRPVLF